MISREECLKKFQNKFESILAKYDQPFECSDIINIATMEIETDNGFLRNYKEEPKEKKTRTKQNNSPLKIETGIPSKNEKESKDKNFLPSEIEKEFNLRLLEYCENEFNLELLLMK